MELEPFSSAACATQKRVEQNCNSTDRINQMEEHVDEHSPSIHELEQKNVELKPAIYPWPVRRACSKRRFKRRCGGTPSSKKRTVGSIKRRGKGTPKYNKASNKRSTTSCLTLQVIHDHRYGHHIHLHHCRNK